MDIDNRELVFHHRRKRIEEKLLQSCATEIARVLSRLVVERCNFCIYDFHSQRQHQCFMMEKDKQLYTYFDETEM